MQVNIVNEISNAFGNTIAGAQMSLSAEQQQQPSSMLGERRIAAEAEHIVQLVAQLGKVLSLEPAVRDAVIQKALHTTTTTTSLLRLLGSANLATSSDTKN